MKTITLPRLGTFEAWRDAARDLAAQGVPPEAVTWVMEGDAPTLFELGSAPRDARAKREVTVPKDFPPLARLLCAARVPGAIDLAYRLLLRVSETRGLLKNRADPEVARTEGIAKNIRRDMHKMKAFVRFREVTAEGAARRQFVSWFEPDHRIEELMGGFFARRFGDMNWAIITPEITMHFKEGDLRLEAVTSKKPDLEDETEALWKTYYANIFNPARLKVKAMQAEMPKKYWKNLPEADLIPDLIAQADARVAEMRETAPTLPPVRAARVLDRLQGQQDAPLSADGLEGLSQALKGCRRCPLAGPATQAVPGEGPEDADLMIVGEQPGDREDLGGRPFIGPAGQLFDLLAGEAGLERGAAYVTNAVKHFKFQVRGKRRIHQSPNGNEISHCRWWLDQEIALIRPKLILAMGATAAQALTGQSKGILSRRGCMENGLHGVPVFLTLHPSALLRQPNPESRDEQTRLVRSDLRAVAHWLAAAA
ncbi:MAG: UdgX family uracil-DNA binding protein [Sulfitobacter sp.]|nr:UdgX family uracil-DNA binding protein [Sulfitobacter sp.]